MIRRLAAALAAAAAVAVITTPSALGQATPTPTGAISMTPDPTGGPLTQQQPVITGDFSMGGINGRIEEIDVQITSKADPQVPVPDPNPAAVCNNTPPCGTSPVHFTYTLPVLPYNGPYTVGAFAFGSADIPPTNHVRGDAAPVAFKLAVAPAMPANVSAQYDTSVGWNIVRWDRNSEPDLHRYTVERKGPGDKDFKVIGSIDQSRPGAQLAIGEQASQGDYQYKVDAWRAGPDGNTTPDFKKDADSGYSPVAKVTVPAPPPGSTAPHGPPPVPTLTPVSKSQLPKSSSSSRSSSRSGSSSGDTTLTTESVSPDAGFARGSADVTSTIPGGADDSGRAIAILPKSNHSSSNRLAIFGPVAGGAVLFMFAFHLRYLKGRLDQIPPPT